MPSAEFKKKGSFADVVLPALLVHAVNARFTGMFRAERDSIIKVIYFKEGEIAFASSNQPSDRLGEVLIKRGQLTREQLDMAMSKLEANVSLGRMLVELGYLSPKELLSGAKTQVEEILYSLNTWKDGGYEFTEGPLPPRIVDLKLNTRQVIFQCILQVEDRRWALEQAGSMESVFAPQPELADALQQMRLEPEVQQILQNIDGTNTVRDLASRSRLDEFTVTKVVAALYLLNLTRLTVHEATEHGGEYLARFGEESETTTGDSTVIGRPPGSETMPGFAPGFGAGSSFGSPYGGFDEPTGEPTLRPSEAFAPPPAMEGSLDDEMETSTRPGFREEPLVAPEEAGDDESDEEMAYEEEELEDDDTVSERPRWLLPAIAGGLVLLIAGAGYWFLYGRSGAGGGSATPVVRLSPSATPRTMATTSPVRPTATPTAAVAIAAGTASASPTRTLPPLPTLVAVATPVASLPGTRSPLPTSTIAVTTGGTPVVGRPTPAVTATAARPTPAATAIAGRPTPAGAAPTATRVALGSPTPLRSPATAVVGTLPALPSPTRVAVLSTPTPVIRATPAPRATPAARTPLPAPTRATAAGSGGELGGPAATQAHQKLSAGQFREAAQAFRQAASAASGYTIQLEIVCQESSVRDGLGQAGGGQEYFILPFTYRGKPCYRVFWGVYPSRSAAEQAARQLPPFFRSQAGNRPLPIVPISGVR